MKLNPLLGQLEESITLKLNSKVKAMAAEGKRVFNLTVGELDFPTPKAIQKEVAKHLAENKYAPTLGIKALRMEIAQEWGKPYTFENVAVTTGAKQALYYSFLAILQKGDEVIIPTPAWVSYEHIIRMAGGKPVLVPLGAGYQLDISAIKKSITKKTKAILITTPHNPTGSVMHDHSLRQLSRLVSGKEIFIVADTIYKTLVFDRPFTNPTVFFKDRSKVIIIDGFSKSHALTGWRVGYVVADKEIMQGINKLQGNAAGNASLMGQYAGIAAIRHPEVSKQFVKVLQKRKGAMEKILDQMPYVEYHKPEGAFYFFIDIGKITKNSARFCEQLLEQYQVAAVPGEAFHAPGFIRLSFAQDEKVLKEAMGRIRKFIEKILF